MGKFRLACAIDAYEGAKQRPPKPRWLATYYGQRLHSFQYWTKIYWATPPWILKHIPRMKCKYESTPEGHELDHIVPLKSDLVCGLHVPWNFQHLPSAINQYKSNDMWPGHPNENIDMFEVDLHHQFDLFS